MTDIFGRPEKLETRNKLFRAAIDGLARKKVGRWSASQALRQASVRRITRDGIVKTVSIRTSQDQWVAFLRDKNTGEGWKTLDTVDYVAASTVDYRDDPKFAVVHLFDAAEIRDRFDRNYAARKAAGHKLYIERGIWISLYEKERPHEPTYVGAGAGLDHPAIYRVPLTQVQVHDTSSTGKDFEEDSSIDPSVPTEAPLTIAEAKRRLALAFGVAESDVKITVSG